MPTERKLAQVAELEERFRRAVIVIGLDYRGLTVAQMRDLRLALRQKEPTMELRVVKNSMVKRAADNVGNPGLNEIVQEATAFLFGYEEVVNPPKAITDYLRANRLTLTLHGAVSDSTVLSSEQVADLATLPGRGQLMATLAGGISNPISGLASAISAVLRQLAAGVEARAAQLETTATPATEGAGHDES